MKRTLIVMRHAKTESQAFGQEDYDRNLVESGKADALKMGELLTNKDFLPQQIIASRAKRTQQTAEIIAQQLNYDKNNIQLLQNLYLCDSRTLANVIENLDNSIQCCMVIAHNPGVSEFVFDINRAAISTSLPTSGMAVFSFVSDTWQDLFMVKNKIELIEYPKHKL